MAMLDRLHRRSHAFSEVTTAEDNSILLATIPRVSVHLVETVSSVIDTNRLHAEPRCKDKDDRIRDDFSLLGSKCDGHPRARYGIELGLPFSTHAANVDCLDARVVRCLSILCHGIRTDLAGRRLLQRRDMREPNHAYPMDVEARDLGGAG